MKDRDYGALWLSLEDIITAYKRFSASEILLWMAPRETRLFPSSSVTEQLDRNPTSLNLILPRYGSNIGIIDYIYKDRVEVENSKILSSLCPYSSLAATEMQVPSQLLLAFLAFLVAADALVVPRGGKYPSSTSGTTPELTAAPLTGENHRRVAKGSPYANPISDVF